MTIFPKLSALALAGCLLGASATASAGLITQINGLDVNGIQYDVTFHPGESFNDLWDSNGDGVFGNDASRFNAAPTFWGNPGNVAVSAREALIAYFNEFSPNGSMGTSQASPTLCPPGTTTYCDGFLIPFAYTSFLEIFVALDKDADPLSDDPGFDAFSPSGALGIVATAPYASFSPAAEIPEPAIFWLMSLGLVGVGWLRGSRGRSSGNVWMVSAGSPSTSSRAL